MAFTLPIATYGYAATKASIRGRRAGTNRLLHSLLAAPDLSDDIAAKTHRLAASQAAALGRYSVARRHLRAAVRIDPTHAMTRYRLAQAYEFDPFGSDTRAAKNYKAAAKLDRKNASYRAAYGRAAVRAGERADGIRSLLKAAKMSPADVAVLNIVVEGLLDAGRVHAAERIVSRARFLGGKIATLLNQVRFASARAAQRNPRPTAILPFLKLMVDESGRMVRTDPPSRPRPHLLVRFVER